MAITAANPKFTDVIVAVHGIGQQSRFSTVQSVANRFAASKELLQGCRLYPVAPQPLGYFHSEVKGITTASLLDDADALRKTHLESIGFGEVFWADIPEEVVEEGRTMEETKAWASTVVARAQALCMRAKAEKNPGILPPDFSLAGEVLDEVIETVYVLENLCFLADKAGLFKFDFNQLMKDYLGDVQVVTEFGEYRRDIVGRFHRAMEEIYNEQSALGNPDVRLHIVAHSEGTVVSFLGLLHAMSGEQLIPCGGSEAPDAMIKRTGVIPDWLRHVRGYMTIGSPIDKHLLLWPRLWKSFEPSFGDAVLEPRQIKWRNYYDYGDPVGFELDTTRDWLDLKGLKAFEFCDCPKCHHDIGFARYMIAGKAHTDYWNDPEVFEHFIDDVVKPRHRAAQRPQSKPLVTLLAPTVPYVLSFLVLCTGVYLLYKAVIDFVHPDHEALAKYLRFMLLGVQPSQEPLESGLLRNTLGVAALIAGTTLLARFPRLAIGFRWKAAGLIAFGLGSIMYWGLVLRESRHEIGAVFGSLGAHGATVGVWGLAFVVGLIGLAAVHRAKDDRRHRRERWVLRGMRPLILCGALAIGLLVASQLFPTTFGRHIKLTPDQRRMLTPGREQVELELLEEAHFTPVELGYLFNGQANEVYERLRTLERAKAVLVADPPIWPVLLAGAGFLYLWWLATLLFDLAFVWHRYIRNAVANDSMRKWYPFGMAPPKKGRQKRSHRCRKTGEKKESAESASAVI
jgi:hypothetical protein